MTTATQTADYRPLSAAEMAQYLAQCNPGYKWGYNADKSTVGYYDAATDRWLVYRSLCIDGKWREYHGVRVNPNSVNREFVVIN
jgi:hypothetical protein